MRAVITGGAGFIGTHLVEHLAQGGATITILDTFQEQRYFDFDLSAYDFIHGDVANYSQVERAARDCEVIFHLAGLLGTDFLVSRATDAVKVNICGTLNVLEVCRRTDAVLIYLSLLPTWNNPYMITKNAGAQFCQMYHDEFGVKTVILRATHIYGERQKWKPVRKAVPNFIVSALTNEQLRIFGSGDQPMDLIYVKDAVEAITKAATTPIAIGQNIELGSGIKTRVIDLARMIIRLCGSRSTLAFAGKRVGEPESPKAFVPANVRDQSRILSFSPRTELESGLERTIEWYRKILCFGGRGTS